MQVSTTSTSRLSSQNQSSVVSSIKETLLSFEFFFVMFLFAGLYKSQPIVAALKIDPTIAFGGLSLISGLNALSQRNWKTSQRAVSACIVVIIIYAWILASTLWSPSPVSFTKGFTSSLPVVFSIFMALLVVTPDKLRIERLMKCFVPLGVYGLYNLASVGSASDVQKIMELSKTSGSYISRGFILNLASISCFYFFLTIKQKSSSLLWLFFGFCFLIGCFINPSRQTALTCTLTLLFLFIRLATLNRNAGGHVEKSRIASVSFIAMLILIITVGLTGIVRIPSLERALVLSSKEGSTNSSALERQRAISIVDRRWDEKPITGHGAGAYGIKYGNNGLVTDHPHNLILESVYEQGLLGAISWITFLYLAFSKIGSWDFVLKNPLALTILLLGFNALFNLFVSGSYADSRGALAIFCLLFATLSHKPNQPDITSLSIAK
jgi:hypothetical protein